MKKFIMCVLCGLLLGSCGVDPGECKCLPEEDDFFETYYTECFDHCTLCASWAEECQFEYTRDQCLENHWFQGKRQVDCAFFKEIVTQWLTAKDCADYLENPACMFNY